VAAFACRHARAMLDEVDAVDEVALRMQSESTGAGAVHHKPRSLNGLGRIEMDSFDTTLEVL
jgi:hypothetical protein